MSPYYRYKKEKFLEKYQSAYDNLEDIKEAIIKYKKSNSRIIRRAMFAFFQDLFEYIVEICEIRFYEFFESCWRYLKVYVIITL